MKIKVSELKGKALSWAVAKALDCKYGQLGDNPKALAVQLPNGRVYMLTGGTAADWLSHGRWSPWEDWSQGGPLIERWHIEFDYNEETNTYLAYAGVQGEHGETHLIAAMRCFCASKLGDEVDVPEELA